MTFEPSEYRYDPLVGAWTIVAPVRRVLAHSNDPASGPPEIRGRCPFCPGHESDTETNLMTVPETGSWRVRVVANKYPTVYASTGKHEVIIESPQHNEDWVDYGEPHAYEVLTVYRERLRAAEAATDIREVALFRNRGRRAGSSQPHPHGQLVATTVEGPESVRRQAIATEFFAQQQRTLLSHIVRQELEAGSRIVDATDDLVAFCPYASHRNYETWIAPREPMGSFSEASDSLLVRFSQMLQKTLRRTLKASHHADYNLVWRLPLCKHPIRQTTSWHIEILPRRGGQAGFELATGIDVITIPPEAAAETLRALTV